MIKVEFIEFGNIPISVDISPTTQYIALSFVGINGVYLWINRTLYMNIPQIEAVTEPIKIEKPFSTLIRSQKKRKSLYSTSNSIEKNEEKITKEVQELVLKNQIKTDELLLSEHGQGLISLSKQSQTKYRILNNLDLIMEKSEPKVKNKNKAEAPFFLFNLNDLGLPVKLTKSDTKDNGLLNILNNYSHFTSEKQKSKIEELKTKKDLILTELLDNYETNYITSKQVIMVLNALNPFIIDLEIRNLDTMFNNNSNKYLMLFLSLINEELDSKTNFEMLQGYLNRFLKVR